MTFTPISTEDPFEIVDPPMSHELLSTGELVQRYEEGCTVTSQLNTIPPAAASKSTGTQTETYRPSPKFHFSAPKTMNAVRVSPSESGRVKNPKPITEKSLARKIKQPAPIPFPLIVSPTTTTFTSTRLSSSKRSSSSSAKAAAHITGSKKGKKRAREETEDEEAEITRPTRRLRSNSTNDSKLSHAVSDVKNAVLKFVFKK